MANELYALAVDPHGLLCAPCAKKEYPDGNWPADSTPIYHRDEWKRDVRGICIECKKQVG